jgi:hypothetical protein
MKIKLVLARTEYDPVTAWTATKTIEVEIPLDKQDGWQVIGAQWPEEEGLI